jgi:hypothetical protein
VHLCILFKPWKQAARAPLLLLLCTQHSTQVLSVPIYSRFQSTYTLSTYIHMHAAVWRNPDLSSLTLCKCGRFHNLRTPRTHYTLMTRNVTYMCKTVHPRFYAAPKFPLCFPRVNAENPGGTARHMYLSPQIYEREREAPVEKAICICQRGDSALCSISTQLHHTAIRVIAIYLCSARV